MQRILRAFPLWLLGAVLGAASADRAAAQATFLVADVNARPLSPPSYPAGFVRAGALVFFSAETQQYGRELYTTLGRHENPSTTALVLDIRSGGASSSPDDLTAIGNLLFFTADDGTSGRELWVSDGTPGGTRRVHDIHMNQGSSSPDSLVAHAGTLFFSADDGVHGRELWRSDGTANGTAMVLDIDAGATGSRPTYLASATGALYFAAEEASAGRELWASDGTSAGTRRVADLVPGSGDSNPYDLVALGSRVVFNAYDPVHGTEPWGSDGTAAGTAMLGDLYPGTGGAQIQAFTRASNAVYFFAFYSALWKTDGTPAGTTLVSNHFLGTGYGAAAIGSGLVFAVRNNTTGSSIWASDGTPGGTQVLRGGWTSYGLTELTTIGSTVWFQGSTTTTANQGALWRTDGTVAGTALVATIHRQWPYLGGGPYGFAECANGRIAFSADDGDHGREPWVTDGTTAGTLLLRDLEIDLARTLSAVPREMVDVIGTAFFAADDGFHGEELWMSDGTVFGTRLVLDIYPGRERSFLIGMTRVGNRAFFSAEDGVHGRELWVSDGTAAGTRMVVDLNPGPSPGGVDSLTAYRGAIYFAAHDGQSAGLWRSDGTVAGTQRLATDVAVSNLRVAGGKLYFAGDEPTRGEELWCSDGTPAGTFLVADVDPTITARGPQSSSPYEFVDFGGSVHFVASHTNYGYGDLWRTDGTAAGTHLVANLPFPGVAAPHSLTPVASQLFFVVTELPSGASGLWRSDGTVAGTRPVTTRAADVRTPVPLGDRVLFQARTGLQSELWISDGTDPGTSIVRDLHPTASASPIYLTPIGTRRVIFSANDGSSGAEPWITDGTSSGTQRIADLALTPSSASSNPRLFTLSRGRVLFSADDGFLGEEIWSHFPGATARRFGDGCAPNGEAPALTGADPVLGQISALEATRVPLGSLAFLMVSAAPAALIDLGGCSLYLDLATAFVATAFATNAPSWTLHMQVPHGPHLVGQRAFAQVLYALPIAGFSLTNAVEYGFGL